MPRPQQFRPCMVILTESETARVHRFIEHVGFLYVAAERLGTSRATLDAARDFGKMQRSTRDRLLDALTLAGC